MPRVGNTIGGKYVLQEPIGEGAMGSVWRAVHQTLGRPFAVKFLKAYGASSELEARFIQEARLAAAIQHRFVVSIVDFGLTDEATPYMVMEFLHGESLSARLAHAPPLPVRELVRIVAQALVGLEAVHQAGVIHRDLKPENIMLVAEAGGEIPKLVDFGISRAENPVERLAPSPLTAPGTAMGTPWYMSPEQVRGLPIDRRTDLYSVGVMLYRSLTGQFPYDAPTVSELVASIGVGGAAPVLGVRPDLGPLLAAIVDRAIAPDPGARFGSASEMAASLFAVMGQLPEPLACPMRPGDGLTSPQRLSPRSIVPGDAEVSSDALAPTSGTSQANVAGPLSSWLARPSTWWAAGSGALAIAIVLVATTMLRPPRPRPAAVAGAGVATTESLPAVVPLDPPAPAEATAGRAGATDPTTAASAVRVAERAHAEAGEPARPKRARVSRKPKRGGEPPPEAFTNPGF
jgi:serine/threonine-protein kinase